MLVDSIGNNYRHCCCLCPRQQHRPGWSVCSDCMGSGKYCLLFTLFPSLSPSSRNPLHLTTATGHGNWGTIKFHWSIFSRYEFFWYSNHHSTFWETALSWQAGVTLMDVLLPSHHLDYFVGKRNDSIAILGSTVFWLTFHHPKVPASMF